MKDLKDVMNALPAHRRVAIEARVEALIAAEMARRDLRKTQGLTQENLAELPSLKQNITSRLRGQVDRLLSILPGGHI